MVRKSWSILALALVITCSVARAEVGLSYLALCHETWPCGPSLNAFHGLPVIRTGWLENTFAPDCKCAVRLLNDPRPKVVRVHLTNGACLRNQRCGPYEVFAGETIASANRKIMARDKVLLFKFRRVVHRLRDRLIASQGELTCYVSPCLECDLNDQSRRLLHAITRRVLPGCSLVDSPHGRPCLEDTICEGHGPKPKLNSPCIADLDGKSVEQVSVEKYLERTKQCDLSYIWHVGMNCNSHTGPFVDPRARNCSKPKGYFRRHAKWLSRE